MSLLEDYEPDPEPADGRDCGRRRKGGAYWKTGVGEGGTPMWQFLKDPPIVRDWNAMGISPQGMTLIQDEESGIYHAYDWVGAKFYPYFPDHYEEGGRHGFSGYVPSNFDWSKITPGVSRRRLIHPKGSLTNAAELWPHRLWQRCKTWQKPHTDQGLVPADWLCISFLWELLEGESVTGKDYNRRLIRRQRTSFSYLGLAIPDGFVPQWQAAYVMDLPLTCVEVIRDPDNGSHEETINHIFKRNQQLPLALVNE